MYSIMQPGSTVATALSMGESKPKHVFMLELDCRRWRHVQIPLETVRPFVFENIVLKDQSDVDEHRPESIDALLASRVERLITTATRGDMLPLIRLRVDYTGVWIVRLRAVEDSCMVVLLCKQKLCSNVTGSWFNNVITYAIFQQCHRTCLRPKKQVLARSTHSDLGTNSWAAWPTRMTC